MCNTNTTKYNGDDKHIDSVAMMLELLMEVRLKDEKGSSNSYNKGTDGDENKYSDSDDYYSFVNFLDQ